MVEKINDQAQNILFQEARTQNAWQDTEVSAADLEAVWDLVKMAPTSANCSPARNRFCYLS